MVSVSEPDCITHDEASATITIPSSQQSQVINSHFLHFIEAPPADASCKPHKKHDGIHSINPKWKKTTNKNNSHFVAVECVRNWYFRNVNTWVSVNVYMHWYVYKYMWFLCTFYVKGLAEKQMHILQCLCSCFWSDEDHLDWLAFSRNANNLFINFFLHTWVVFSGLPVTDEGWTLRPCCQTASSEVGID